MRAALLSDVCEIVMGQAPPGDSYNSESAGYPLIAGAGDFGPIYPEAKKFTTTPTKLSEPGDVILGIRATIGVKTLADRVYCLGRGVAGLRAGDDLDERFLWNWLTFAAPELAAKGKGATFKQVNRVDIGEMRIPLPPLDEQRRIAAILDHADALRAKRREALAHLDELTQSIFIEMFGDAQTIHTTWPKVALRDILLDIESGRSPNCHARPATDDEYGVLKLGAVTYGVFNPSHNKALPKEVEPDVRHEVKTGDLLFTRKNTADLVGAAALVRETRAKLLLPDLIFRLRIDPSSAMNATYLQAVLMYPPIRRAIQGLAGGSAGSMPNISKAKLLTVEVPRAASEQQLSYERRIDEIERLKSGHRTALAELDALFASLQSRAFRGQL